MRTRKALRAAAAKWLALPARAGDPLTEAMTPLDPKAPITFGVGQPNGPKRAAEGKALLEPYLSAAMKRPVTVVILEDYEALADSGYLFPRALLAAQGKSPDRFFARQSFAGGHPGVCDAVRAGKAEAGATFSDERPQGEKLTADGCAESPPVSDFRVVASSGPIPNDVIAPRPGFDERLVEPTLALFAQMSQGEEGRRVLREVFRVDGWDLAVDGDFRPVVEALKVAAPAKPAATSSRKPAKPGK
jgi:hypothetical protein